MRPAAGVSLANGDGLTYLGDDEEIHGLAVNRADPAGRGLVRLTLRNRRELPEGLRRGMTLMRNLDRSFVRELSGESAVRRIPIVMTFLVEDDALTLIVTDGRECAEAHVAMDLDAPSNPERNRGDAHQEPRQARRHALRPPTSSCPRTSTSSCPPRLST